MTDLVLMSLPALALAVLLAAVLRRRLRAPGLRTAALAVLWGVVGIAGLAATVFFALRPIVEADIAACLANGRIECEDANLLRVIPILVGGLAIMFWIGLATVVRLWSQPSRRS